MKHIKTVFCIGLSAAALSACTPTTASRGNIVEDFRMADVIPGVSSRSDVLQNLGSPTTQAPFDDDIWYYLGQKTEKRGIFDPEVVEERIVRVVFNQEGVVETIEDVNNERVDLPIVDRKTPTGGNEVTVLQQMIGNLGRFNKPVEDER